MPTHVHRRTFVGTVGVAVTAAIAGCSDGGDGADGDGTDGETTADGTTADGTTEQGGDTDATPGTSTATPATTDGEGNGGGTSVDEFLADTSNYDGIEDLTGSDSVEVAVGAEGNGAFFAFAPPAIRIDGGTTVTWTWTGQGGTHNVQAMQGADFESELTGEEGATFERQFEDPGTVLYVCSPHSGAGMKGAIVVE